jgi:hypothetical protein
MPHLAASCPLHFRGLLTINFAWASRNINYPPFGLVSFEIDRTTVLKLLISYEI